MSGAPAAANQAGVASLLRELLSGIVQQRTLAIAAGVTFYCLLALVPAIAAAVSVYGLFADPKTIAEHLDMVSAVLPGGAIEILRDQITRLAAEPSRTLGIAFFVALGLSLWSASGGTQALFDALNVVRNVAETRSFIELSALSLAFVLGGVLFLLLAVAAVIALPVVSEAFALPSETKWTIGLLEWPLMFFVAAVVIELVYRHGACRCGRDWRWISWGSAFAAAGWIATSLLFSWYAANFGNFNKTYGSLGALVGFMLWIWISVTVILIGAELEAVLERRREHQAPRYQGARERILTASAD